MTRTTMKRTRGAAIALSALIVSMWGIAPVAAQAGQIEVFMTVKPPDANSKAKDDAPTIEATVVGGPTVPVGSFSLVDPGAKPPVTLKALNLRPYTAGTETIAIAFVINGQEVWIGNDDIEAEESPARHLGILKNLKQALQTVQFSSAGPAGSKGVLISYGDKAEVKVAMGPIANITPEALGTQRDYYRKFGTAMVEGINLAVAELHNVTASRKALIVVCDGNDTNNEAAKAQLQTLKKQAANEKIQTFAIIYKGELSEPGNVITAMIPTATTVSNAEGISSTMSGIISRMSDRYYLSFPGYDPKLNYGLTWDGKVHDLVIKIDKDDTDAVPLQLSPVWNPPKKGGFPWWILIVSIVGGLLLLIILAKVFGGKKEEPMPMPMPMAAAPAPAEPPKPMGPAKTVMFNASGSDDGFPVVGWLVPLNGQNAYQTFRLRSGGTKIGTAPPSDIVINDGFMSTDHCHINASPQGFVLVDPGSTNGCYVNDRKVQKHELVDNDTITLGKTNFKFKSIN
jgi:hypothetical protein